MATPMSQRGLGLVMNSGKKYPPNLDLGMELSTSVHGAGE